MLHATINSANYEFREELTIHQAWRLLGMEIPTLCPEVFLNRLISPHRDKQALAPEYKFTAVRVDKL